MGESRSPETTSSSVREGVGAKPLSPTTRLSAPPSTGTLESIWRPYENHQARFHWPRSFPSLPRLHDLRRSRLASMDSHGERRPGPLRQGDRARLQLLRHRGHVLERRERGSDGKDPEGALPP